MNWYRVRGWLVDIGAALCLCAVVAVLALMLAGCRIESPISGQQADEKQLAQEWEAFAARKQREAEDAAGAAASAIADAKADADLALTRLRAKTDVETAEIEAAFNRLVRQIDAESRATLTRIESESADMKGRMDAAVATLQSRNAILERVLGVGLAVGESVPGGAPIVSILTTLFGVAGLGAAVRKARESKENEAAGRSLVNAIDLLRARNPAVADAMKSAKADILGQLTDRARQIVESERLT